MKKYLVSLLTVLTAFALVSCGSSKRDAGSYAEAPMAAAEAAAAYDTGNYSENSAVLKSVDYADEEAEISEAATSEGGSESVGEEGAESVKQSKRKLITTVNLETESDDVEGFSKNMEKRIVSLGGYVESSNVYSGSGNYDNYYDSSSKSAEITARIPAEKLPEFLNDVDGSSNIVRKSVNTRDVTLEYTDTEAHERALSAEQKSLEKMMEHAESIDDILAIQTQLTDVRYRLDSIRSQLRTYDNDITYSTVYISVTETRKFTVTKEETAWEKIRNGFTENLIEVMDAISDFIIYFITHIPAFIVLVIVIFILVRVAKRISRSRKEKKEKRERKAEVVKAEAVKAETEKEESVKEPENGDKGENE